MHAVRALSALAGKAAMADITPKLGDESFMVKESAKAAVVGHIEEAMPYLEKILLGADPLARREAVEALETSGQAAKLLECLIADDVTRRARAETTLKAMIEASAYAGIEEALGRLGSERRANALAALKKIRADFAEHVEMKLKQQICEI